VSTPQQAVCPQCGGTGWKEVGTTGGRRVTRCDCVLGNRAQRLLDRARIPARYEHCEFDSFEPDYAGSNPSLERALLEARKFVAEYPVENNGLLFIGPIGVGKTHLAVSILKELVGSKGVPCLFYDYRELLKQIQNSYNPSEPTTEMQVLRPVFEAEVLVLDELGAVKPTEWVWDTVSHILNTRYNDKRTTLITTNYPDQAAGEAARRSFSQSEAARAAARDETLGDRIGERMRSRLHEMCRTVEMRGEDFRQKVHKASRRDF
jgi:DNA replication protein DnaC